MKVPYCCDQQDDASTCLLSECIELLHAFNLDSNLNRWDWEKDGILLAHCCGTVWHIGG